jgi:hypothetical protein
MYIITLIIFLATLTLPFLFLLPIRQTIKRRLVILIIQAILFIAWNYIFYGMMNNTLPYSFGVWGTGDPEGSVFMAHWLLKPAITFILFIEIFYLLGYQILKNYKK